MDAENDNPNTEDLDAMLSRVTDNLVSILRMNGIGRDLFLDYVDKSFSKEDALDVSRGVNPSLAPGFKDLVGTLMAEWKDDSSYVDQTMGDPIDIPIDGDAPSFRSLYDKSIDRYPGVAAQHSFDQTVELMLDYGCIAKKGPLLSFVRSFIYMSNNSTASALSFLAYLDNIAGTLRRNALYPDSNDRRFQRECVVPDFPVRFLPLLNKTLEDQGMKFLYEMDDMLEGLSKDDSGTTDEERVKTGVAVILYSQDDDDFYSSS